MQTSSRDVYVGSMYLQTVLSSSRYNNVRIDLGFFLDMNPVKCSVVQHNAFLLLYAVLFSTKVLTLEKRRHPIFSFLDLVLESQGLAQ